MLKDKKKRQPDDKPDVGQEQSFESKRIQARMTFTEGLLGTAAANPDVHREYIASKSGSAPKIEEEVAALGVDEVVGNSMSVFSRDEDGKPILWDYQIKGFFKDACGVLARIKRTGKSKDLKAYKKVIDGLIFVSPRMIPIKSVSEIDSCQRPLRAQTAQGERIALSNSESIGAGAYIDITIELLDPELEPFVNEWLEYGKFRGIGQWRNSGKGRFKYELLPA